MKYITAITSIIIIITSSQIHIIQQLFQTYIKINKVCIWENVHNFQTHKSLSSSSASDDI